MGLDPTTPFNMLVSVTTGPSGSYMVFEICLLDLSYIITFYYIRAVRAVRAVRTDTTCVLQEVCELHICNASNVKYRDL